MTKDIAERLKNISLSPEKEKQKFKTLHVNDENVINGDRAYNRNIDTEFKIFEEINANLGEDPNVVGKITLYTDLSPCASCQYVMKQFKEKYPNIDISIIYKLEYGGAQ